MFKLKNYCFSYDYKEKFATTIFKDVNINIDNKKILLVGESGSGKSTLFKTLIGYLKPSEGIIQVPKEIGLVLQNVNNQIISGNIYDEINLGYKKKFKKNITIEEIEEYFKNFNINFNLKNNPNKLSGGQKKMIILISVVCTNPDFLILDEPFVGLDQKRRNKLIYFLKNTNIPFLLSSHDIEDNYKIYDQIITIENKDIKKISLQNAIDKSIIKKPGDYND